MLDFCRHHLAPTDFGTRQGDAAITGIWVLFSFRRIHCSLLGLRRILCSTLCCSRVMRRIMPMHAKWNTIRRWYSILLVFFYFPILHYAIICTIVLVSWPRARILKQIGLHWIGTVLWACIEWAWLRRSFPSTRFFPARCGSSARFDLDRLRLLNLPIVDDRCQ